ncbi:MAG: hypothetical protein JWP29_2325 [Rhodoferax sp.]|nr:hypothetical protein [Rhodoferax sp.]
MSYSFTIRAATKAAAKLAVAAKLAEVLAAQPTHAVDMSQAQAAADSFIDVVVTDESKDVAVAVSGWVSFRQDGEQVVYVGTGFGVSANLVEKQV